MTEPRPQSTEIPALLSRPAGQQQSLRRVGIIDLGSNTARLVVYECQGTFYRLVDSIRERVRLAEGINRDRTLSPAAISRALAAMRLFHDYQQAVQLDQLELIATSAVRDATNRDLILDPLRQMGFDPQILSGQEEAAHGVLAVANTSALSDAWVIDQGGGSIQVSLMRDRQLVHGHSFPLGTLRLTERFLATDPENAVSASSVQALETHLDRALGPIVQQMRQDPFPIVCMGGTIRSLANASQHQQRYPLPLLHGYRLSEQSLQEICWKILQAGVTERQSLPGLSADRADVAAAGAITFQWLLRLSQRNELILSGAGVREGALFRSLIEPPWLLEDVRRFSVANLFHHYPQPLAHIKSVISLALQLFDHLLPVHGLAQSDRQLLEAAATLHDVGMIISYYRHHKHGAFLIRAAGLDGFEHRDLALISLMVFYHRKGTPEIGSMVGILDQQEDRHRLLVLSACLRLAEHLERSKTGRVGRTSVEIGGQSVVLNLHSSTRPTVEMWEAEKDGDLFELAFGRRLALAHRGS